MELANIFHTGQVETGSCFQRVFGNIQTALILKDISLEVRPGEVLAVLGSKGSGKRALLEVISRRSSGTTRGEIILDGTPMSPQLFQTTCGYVNHRTDLIPSLTVEQTLYYAAHLSIGPQVSRYVRNARIRQVLADLALSNVARRNISELTPSEHRRVVIGTQLVKDPVLLLLDEPTVNLDPLSTYLIVSMLSSYAKRKSRAVLLTMEKPRSDVLPFLDRTAYLCLGDLIYAGPTRLMLEYFRSIGFPCPELENPLMYYLCLSTVDRRSRERFIESNNQIVALVEKFKIEGGPYRKCASSVIMDHGSNTIPSLTSHKMPLVNFSKPGAFQVFFALYRRMLVSAFNPSQLCVRLLLLPFYFSILYLFYFNMQDYQWSYMSRNGLIFSCMSGAYFVSIFTAAFTFPVHRTRYYQEAQEGLYSGPLFVLTYIFFSLPFSILSVGAASWIIFQTTGLSTSTELFQFSLMLWSCFLFAEYQTIALMLIVESGFTAAVVSSYLTTVFLVLGSGYVRSFRSMAEWLVYLSYGTQTRYVGAFLSRQMFGDGRLRNLHGDKANNCSIPYPFGCRYTDGASFLAERYGHETGDFSLSDVLDSNFNMTITLSFAFTIMMINCVLYLVPIPYFIKAKFRD
uniref:ATP-binding cassette sub-family G member 5 n=1 Tax=Cacopsylla melanoneura TaxID=428564 RepID=A0A8D8X0G3_9HEMI